MKEARWTNKLYTKGARFDYSDTSLLHRIDLLITEINTHFKNDAMSEQIQCLRRTTHNQCIHCASFSHESADHHLSLGIFHVPGNPTPYVHSTPSKTNDVMSQGTPDMGNNGTDKKEQPMPQDITPTIVNASTWPSSLQTLLPSHSLPTMSMPSMAAPTSLRFTNSSQILPTCSPTSASLLHATYQQVCSLQATMNGQQSTHSLRRNGNTSRPLSRLSISSTPMTLRLRSSTTSPGLSMT